MTHDEFEILLKLLQQMNSSDCEEFLKEGEDVVLEVASKRYRLSKTNGQISVQPER